MNKLLLSALVALVTFFTHAQVAMPYTTGFDNSAGLNGWQLFQKGSVLSPPSEWMVDNSVAFSQPAALVHYYPVGGMEVTDDWYVSPAFDISNGGALDSLRYYFSGFGTPQLGDTVFLYLLTEQDPDENAAPVILYEFNGANYQNDNTWRLLAPIALPAQAGNSYFAFRYRTLNNWLDVRFDNLGLSRIATAGISEAMTFKPSIYPNPAADGTIRVQFDAAFAETATLELYTLSGQLVHRTAIMSDEPVALPVAAGMYCYQLHGNTALPISGKLAVQ